MMTKSKQPPSDSATQADASPTPTDTIPTRLAYTVEEGRVLLGGMSRKSLYDLIKSGELATVKIAGRRLIPAASFDALLSTKLAEQKVDAD